jgi:hypothetical protein
MSNCSEDISEMSEESFGTLPQLPGFGKKSSVEQEFRDDDVLSALAGELVAPSLPSISRTSRCAQFNPEDEQRDEDVLGVLISSLEGPKLPSVARISTPFPKDLRPGRRYRRSIDAAC